MERLSWLLIGALWLYAVYAVTQLPTTIPVHFDLSNEPDNYGSKYTLLVLPFIGTLIIGLFGVIKHHPEHLNYPVKITETNRERQTELAFGLLSSIACVIPLLFAFIIYSTVRYVEHGTFNFPILIVVAAVFVPIGVYFYLAYRAR
ncbi:MAG TPA: DUF1648 domain-containing protein [Candidatus Kapabacteria bacterium]|nr:DUF1648 domain-containing protein [Candidatus Kapabacteria bacterium]